MIKQYFFAIHHTKNGIKKMPQMQMSRNGGHYNKPITACTGRSLMLYWLEILKIVQSNINNVILGFVITTFPQSFYCSYYIV